MASLFQPTYRDKKTGATRKLKKWYAKYSNAQGVTCKVPLSTNKTAAKTMLGDIIRRVEMERAGLIDPSAVDHQARPIREHFEKWEQELTLAVSEGAVGQHHADNTFRCARRIIDGAGFVFVRDIAATAVRQRLADLRSDRLAPEIPSKDWFTRAEVADVVGVDIKTVTGAVQRHRLDATGNGKARRFPRATVETLVRLRCRGLSAASANDHLAAFQQFCRWLAKNGRATTSQVQGVLDIAPANVEADRRRERRILTLDEIRQLIQFTKESSRTFRGLNGRGRAMIYLTAMSTGFRAGELAALTPLCFSLTTDNPSVGLSAGETKNEAEANQPLPAEVADELREYIVDRPGREPLWPGTWSEKAADMIRGDLEPAGIPFAVPGRDGPLVADLHALRGSFIVLLERSGATLREAMTLARHSDPKLTMRVYGRLSRSESRDAINRLPSLTDGAVDMARGMYRHGPKPVPADGDDQGRLKMETKESESDVRSNCLPDSVIGDDLAEVRTFEEAPPVGFEPTTRRLTGEQEKPRKTRRMLMFSREIVSRNTRCEQQNPLQEMLGIVEIPQSTVEELWNRSE